MTLKQWKRWEKLRKLGKLNYILLRGGLFFGLILAVMVTLTLHLLDPQAYWGMRLMIYFLVFAFFSMLFSVFAWDRNEKKFMSENPPLPRRSRRYQ